MVETQAAAEEVAESPETGGQAGTGDSGQPTPVEQTGSAAPAGAPAAGGDTVSPAAVAQNAGAVPPAEGQGESPAGGDGQGVASPAGTTPAATRTHAEVSPAFDIAATRINERSDQQFRTLAVEELRGEIHPELLKSLDTHPRLLIGKRVVKADGSGEEETLRDERDALSWQEATKTVIQREVNRRASALADNAKPVLTTVQRSLDVFRMNKDLVPGTKEYNPELARRFMSMTKSFQHEEKGTVLGWRVEVQGLIDQLRTDLATSAPVATPRQEQAAAQPREEATGRFEGPQAGLLSQQGSGKTSTEDDYSAFWSASKFSQPL